MASLNDTSILSQVPPVRDFFTPTDAVILLIIDTVLYIVLYFYLDQIIPNEYGVAKSPFFFITDLFKTKHSFRKSIGNIILKINVLILFFFRIIEQHEKCVGYQIVSN